MNRVIIVYTTPAGNMEMVYGIDSNVWKGVPADAINPREITSEDHPSYPFDIEAWVDVDGQLRVDHDRAKAYQLKVLTKYHDEALAVLQKELLKGFCQPDHGQLVQDKYFKLIRCLDGLQKFNVTEFSQYDDPQVLAKIQELGSTKIVDDIMGF